MEDSTKAVEAKKPQFKLVDGYTHKHAITLVNGIPVNLTGEVLKAVDTLGRERIIRAATQQDFEAVYNSGSNLVVKV